jgi:hypothetical protein
MFHVYISDACAYDQSLCCCVSLCDGKATIFDCGEEKHRLCVQSGNQRHVLCLITDSTLFLGIQTNRHFRTHWCNPEPPNDGPFLARGPFGTRRVLPGEFVLGYQTGPILRSSPWHYVVNYRIRWDYVQVSQPLTFFNLTSTYTWDMGLSFLLHVMSRVTSLIN